MFFNERVGEARRSGTGTVYTHRSLAPRGVPTSFTRLVLIANRRQFGVEEGLRGLLNTLAYFKFDLWTTNLPGIYVYLVRLGF